MKAILISDKPKYVAKILNGEKTIEIRKNMPKCDLPIDVYIYCTKGGMLWKEDKWFSCNIKDYKPSYNQSGKVVAKFTLNKVEEITPQIWTPKIAREILEKSCLKENELFDYICSHNGMEDKPFYAIHISDLEIFDKPKELCKFKHYKKFVSYDYTYTKKYVEWELRPLTKAPQNFYYVEAEE